jgi:hypothetical protein
MTKTRKILLGLLLLGVTGTAIGAGTFASFSASTTNQTSTFATGTLVLTNKVASGSVCSSATGGVDTNANAGCDVIFSGLTNLKPGSTPATADLTIANGGTLTPSALQYALTGCTPDDASGTSVHGSGDPCTAVEVYIQEYDSGFAAPTNSCVFPANGSTPCNTSFSAASDALSNLSTSATTITGGLATSRYFRIGVQLGSSAGNSMQGRKADFSFTWSIVQ